MYYRTAISEESEREQCIAVYKKKIFQCGEQSSASTACKYVYIYFKPELSAKNKIFVLTIQSFLWSPLWGTGSFF